ncbi:hypothetical protein [Streptomyces sp. NPDC126514]|uniref:hypothetical protein n=1 Tax=Streptomyces sp. NPDC126514 TaxID=3155210 RepID=UPI00332DEA69
MADDMASIAVWDPDEVSIRVARDMPAHEVLRELRDMLMIDLGAPVSRGGGPLHCFCGMAVELPHELLSHGRSAEAG